MSLKLGMNYICNPKALFAKYLLCYFDFLSLKENSLWNNLCYDEFMHKDGKQHIVKLVPKNT